jgi:hypothetical protein
MTTGSVCGGTPLPRRGSRASLSGVVLAAFAALASLPAACDSVSSDASSVPPAPSDSGNLPAPHGTSNGFSGCGAYCDDGTPCTGAGMTCLPAASGGKSCKPKTCPSCAEGAFCTYDETSCEPVGCTSVACGFPFTSACEACVKSECCDENRRCANDPACAEMVRCVSGCAGDAPCGAACLGENPVAAKYYQSAFGCDKEQCSEPCYGVPSNPPPDEVPSDAGASESCTYLTECVTVEVKDSTLACAEQGGVQVILTNRCGEAIYCELGVQDPLPPGIGTPVRSAKSAGAVASGKLMAIDGCHGATRPFFNCVPADQAVRCLGAPEPDPEPTPDGPTRASCPTSFTPRVDPACLAALDASCCEEERSCGYDGVCTDCLTIGAERDDCETNAAVEAFVSCRNTLGLVCASGA